MMNLLKTVLPSCLLAACLMIPVASFANAKAVCEDTLKDEGGHCAYVTGLSKSRNDGRYLKIFAPEVGYNLTTCVSGNDDLYFMIYEPHTGSNTDQYFICTDLTGTQCEAIASDTYFATSGSDDKYVTTPNIFAVDMSALRDKYPACSSFWSLNSEQHHSHQIAR